MQEMEIYLGETEGAILPWAVSRYVPEVYDVYAEDSTNTGHDEK